MPSPANAAHHGAGLNGRLILYRRGLFESEGGVTRGTEQVSALLAQDHGVGHVSRRTIEKGHRHDVASSRGGGATRFDPDDVVDPDVGREGVHQARERQVDAGLVDNVAHQR